MTSTGSILASHGLTPWQQIKFQVQHGTLLSGFRRIDHDLMPVQMRGYGLTVFEAHNLKQDLAANNLLEQSLRSQIAIRFDNLTGRVSKLVGRHELIYENLVFGKLAIAGQAGNPEIYFSMGAGVGSGMRKTIIDEFDRRLKAEGINAPRSILEAAFDAQIPYDKLLQMLQMVGEKFAANPETANALLAVLQRRAAEIASQLDQKLPPLSTAEWEEQIGSELLRRDYRQKITAGLTLIDGAPKPTPHQILGVAANADRAAIQAAFDRLARDCHPDQVIRFGDPDLDRDAVRLFQAISEAYRILSDRSSQRGVPAVPAGSGEAAKVQEAVNKALEAEKAFELGETAMRSGKYREAEEHFRAAMAHCPHEVQYKVWRAWALFHTLTKPTAAALDEIERLFAAALDENKTFTEGFFFLGVILQGRGQTERAMGAYTNVLQLCGQKHPGCRPGHRTNAYCHAAETALRLIKERQEREKAGLGHLVAAAARKITGLWPGATPDKGKKKR